MIAHLSSIKNLSLYLFFLPQGGRAVYTTHSPVEYLPRNVASLRIRH